MRAALVVNPCAGRNSGLATAAVAERELARAGWQVEVRPTSGPSDAACLAREAAADGCEAVLACGGDGTFSQVVIGLLDSGVPAGLIPAGTGNDFARTVGLSRRPDVAARQVLAGRAGPLDLLEINGGELWSVNVSGAGFDAAVARRMNARRRSLGGPAAYLTAVCQELVAYRAGEARIEVDGEVWEGRALLVAVANAQSYGAGMRIAPAARVDDGLLDAVVVRAMSRGKFLWHLPQVFRGTHTRLPEVWLRRGREVQVEMDPPSPVLVDGDLQTQTPLRVRIAPGRAQFWWPGPA